MEFEDKSKSQGMTEMESALNKSNDEMMEAISRLDDDKIYPLKPINSDEIINRTGAEWKKILGITSSPSTQE